MIFRLLEVASEFHFQLIDIEWIVQGYNGSQLWDTAFTVQAIVATNLSEEFAHPLKKAHDYIRKTQVNFLMLSLSQLLFVTICKVFLLTYSIFL